MKTSYIVTGAVTLAAIGSVAIYACQKSPPVSEKTQIIHITDTIPVEDTAKLDSMAERYEQTLKIKNAQIAKLKKEKHEIKIDSIANYDILYWLQEFGDSAKHTR